MRKIFNLISIFTLSTFISAQTLNPTYTISTAGSVDIFKGGYTFAYKTSGAPWDGSLISFGGFSNQYDTQISTSYYSNNISFRTRNGDNNTWSNWHELISKDSNGNLAIGENTPIDKLSIKAGHTDSTILLHADNGGNPHVYLSLWASEPQVTYYGVGIGSNVRNATNGGMNPFQKIDPNKGASFMRLLDTEINFNIINSSGTKTTPFVIRANDSFFSG